MTLRSLLSCAVVGSLFWSLSVLRSVECMRILVRIRGVIEKNVDDGVKIKIVIDDDADATVALTADGLACRKERQILRCPKARE